MLIRTQDEITCFRISETWRKHATPCFRYVYVKVVRFRCVRSNGNARKRHETGDGNTIQSKSTKLSANLKKSAKGVYLQCIYSVYGND